MIFIDSEGDPIQEFSALYAYKNVIVDVFHQYVYYPSMSVYDEDHFARSHVHGLDLDFLNCHGLKSEQELLTLFSSWLEKHPHSIMFAHAPAKERHFLEMTINDVRLLPWKKRRDLPSHRRTLLMKKSIIPICNTICSAHTSYCGWQCKRKSGTMNVTDLAKIDFGYHCSLYDSLECFFFYTDCK